MDEIKGIARVRFHPGKLDEWKRLTEQAMEIVRARDPGTLQYEVFFNDDESEAIVFERYRDADAALEHFSNISHLMGPLLATATVTGEVLGIPNERMRAQLGAGEPKLFTPWMAARAQNWARTWARARAREAAGLPASVHFHDLRHAGATMAAQVGGTTREVMARLGHSTARAALIYQHAAENRDRDIAAALDEIGRQAAVSDPGMPRESRAKRA